MHFFIATIFKITPCLTYVLKSFATKSRGKQILAYQGVVKILEK